MKYHIHIPKLLEFALNVVCDDVTLHGKQCLETPIPYPLYLRCIMTYADKYDRDRYSMYRFYRDIRRNVKVSSQIGHLYPNVLDHVVLDDSAFDVYMLLNMSYSVCVDDVITSIQRFASRCLSVGKSEMVVTAFSRVICSDFQLSQPLLGLLLLYGAKLNPNEGNYFSNACFRGMNDVVIQAIATGHIMDEDDMYDALRSGKCSTIKLVFRLGFDLKEYLRFFDYSLSLRYASVEFMELILTLNIIERATHYSFSNIPSYSVLQWILDHDVMKHDRLLFDIASNAAYYSSHYFDMLRYLIEQRNFTVPRDFFVKGKRWLLVDLDVLDYLFLHGADVNAVDTDGQNVLERSPMLIRYWVDKGLVVKLNDGRQTILRCCRNGITAPALKMVIDKYSINIDDTNDTGNTVLHWACGTQSIDIVETLIACGADVNARDNNGETPVQMTTNKAFVSLYMSLMDKMLNDRV